MSNVVTATPIWKLWADALDRSKQGIAFVTNAGNQCAPTAGAGLTVNIASGTVVVNSNTTTTAITAGSVTPTSPTNNPRRDIVFISSLGAISLTQGTEAPAPLPPALPTGACLLAALFIPTSATDYSAGFPTGGIEDLRVIVNVDNATGIASPRTLGTGAQQAAAGNHTTPAATATVAGHVPTPPNDATKVLLGNATWGAGASGGTPAVVLGTTAAAGVATTFVRDDDTIVAFDTTVPVTQAASDAAATGSAAVAARRDHKHGMGAFKLGGQSASATITANITTTSSTFVDATGLSVTITTTGGDVIVYFSCVLDDTAGQDVYVTLAKDGTNVAAGGAALTIVNPQTTGAFYACSFTYRDAAPTAASHTYKIQWREDAGGQTATMHAAAANTSIVVQELPH